MTYLNASRAAVLRSAGDRTVIHVELLVDAESKLPPSSSCPPNINLHSLIHFSAAQVPKPPWHRSPALSCSMDFHPRAAALRF